MFKWLKKLFGKEEEVQEKIEVERVSLEKIDISEPLLKSDEPLETTDTRYTDDYASFVESQMPSEEEVIDRSMPVKMREKTEEEREAEWLPPESRYTKDYKKFVETQIPKEEDVVTKEVDSEELEETAVETEVPEEVVSEEFDDPFVDDPEEEGSFEEDVYDGETAVYETLLEPLDEEDTYEDE